MKIVLSTGGTGGHVFPALTTAKVLTGQGHQVFFVGALARNLERIKTSGFPAIDLETQGLTFQSAGKVVRSLTLMSKALVRSFRVLGELKPDAVCGFGGYGAFAVVSAAVLSGIPAMIHEQNVVPGRANKLLSRSVRRAAISFKESEKFFGTGKAVWTGCPCRNLKVEQTRESLLREFGLSTDKFTILVQGGSQGSQRVNQTFAESAKILKKDLEFQVLHLSGVNDSGSLKETYQQLGIQGRVFEFLEAMEKAYAAADLIVSRAGALTVTEIALSCRPAVLIPYPYAGGHQIFNARVLVERGCARMIEEKDLTPRSLADAVLASKNESVDRRMFESRLEVAFPGDAAQRLAQEIVRLRQ